MSTSRPSGAWATNLKYQKSDRYSSGTFGTFSSLFIPFCEIVSADHAGKLTHIGTRGGVAASFYDLKLLFVALCPGQPRITSPATISGIQKVRGVILHGVFHTGILAELRRDPVTTAGTVLISTFFYKSSRCPRRNRPRCYRRGSFSSQKDCCRSSPGKTVPSHFPVSPAPW